MDYNYGNNNSQGGGKGTIAMILGIVGLVVSILGGIMFGIIGGILGAVLGIVAIVMSVSEKKKGGATSAGMVCGILGLVFGVIFTIGCAVCGAASADYLCYGTVAGSCMFEDDVEDALGRW